MSILLLLLGPFCMGMLIIILSRDNVYLHVSTAYRYHKSKAHYDYNTLPLNFQSEDLGH